MNETSEDGRGNCIYGLMPLKEKAHDIEGKGSS